MLTKRQERWIESQKQFGNAPTTKKLADFGEELTQLRDAGIIEFVRDNGEFVDFVLTPDADEKIARLS